MRASGGVGIAYHSEPHNSPTVLRGWSIFILSLYFIVDPCFSCCPFSYDHSLVYPSDYLFFIFNLFLSYFVFDSTLRNVLSLEDICRAIHITCNTLLCAYDNCHVLLARNIP